MTDRPVSRPLNRRELLTAGLAAPLAVTTARRQAPASSPGPPPYTLSINIELMFRATKLSKADRVRAVADKGFTAYSFWSASPEERAAIAKAQHDTGLKCVSIVGTGDAGGSTGFTRPGAQDALLAEIRERVEIARQFGTPDLISFVGRLQTDVPWDVQRRGIVDGLKRAADVAAAGGVRIAFEPLSVGPNQQRYALDRAADAFPVIQEVNHPHLKVCFDMFHLQQTEGNLTFNLRRGLAGGLIALVQIGDVPGRLEPGTGEIDYAFMFRELRRLDYRGYVDTEMGTSSTAEHAMDVARRLSLEN